MVDDIADPENDTGNEQRSSGPSMALRIGNPIMKFLLRSSMHGIASGQLMLITVTGRKTGKKYTTPVNFVQNENLISVVSHKHRTWWRNLRGGAPVTLRLRGEVIQAQATVLEEPTAVADALIAHLQEVPQYAEALGVGLDEEGEPMAEDGLQAAVGKVMVQITLPQTDSA